MGATIMTDPEAGKKEPKLTADKRGQDSERISNHLIRGNPR
jgi:hypothetical protein